MINPYNLIAKPFWEVLDSVLIDAYIHFVLKGGRGSTKSSFVGIAIPLLMMLDAQEGIHSNCVALRKTGETIADSIYAQFLWGINKLGVSEYWQTKKSPLELIYKPTGQKILFRSSNNQEDYIKIKSLKFEKGFCKYVWYEEVTEFFGMEEIRNINQSLLRGGSKYKVFYTYNPPKSISHWVYAEMINKREDRLIHSSTYLEVPKDWLGEQFFIEADELKKQNKLAYENEYLGKPTGTGGAIFTNLNIRKITDDEIKRFDNISDGLDFGFAVDPACYTQNYYDKTRKKLYIFNEIYSIGMSNSALWNKIVDKKIGHSFIIADSAEPKSISELNSYGKIRTMACKKGPDSIDYGIRWLQQLSEIVIDNERCPNTAREFSLYEYLKDKYGNFISKYPDMNNHSIDATRYSRESEMNYKKMQFGKIKIL